jgi:hypothetical protein
LLATGDGTSLATFARMRHLLWRVPLVALLAVVAARAALHRENLHCDQYTSLRIVLFDMEPHEEERLSASGAVPLAYDARWAVPVRVLFALAFPVAMLGPAAMVAVSRSRVRVARRVLGSLAAFAAVALPLLGFSLGGERAGWLALLSFWLGGGALCYAAAAIVVWRDRRNGARGASCS